MNAAHDTATAAPEWLPGTALSGVLGQLGSAVGLVSEQDCAELLAQLGAAAAGTAHVVQGGDCAEMFDEVSAHTTRRKAAQLAELTDLVELATALPAVTIGRLAGQFAKPRSAATEVLANGEPVPVYRGDAVNGTDVRQRTPDPTRMLTAYHRSAEIHGHLAALRPRVFTSHEALLLDFENALVRSTARGPYASSAHLLWVGERTRHPLGRHVDLLARITNPVAVKLGPSTAPEDLRALVDVLDPDRVPGRLSFITRLGARGVTDLLPSLAAAARAAGCRPVWLCDPMHANSRRTAGGRKIRLVDDVRAEVLGFVAALRAAGAHPGGVHLELTPDDVTECVSAVDDPAPRYWTGCDPRLNPTQAREIVRVFAEAVAA